MQSVLPLFNKVEHEFSPIDAVVLARCVSGAPAGATYSHLAGSWRQTLHGLAFTLLRQHASGPVTMAAPPMPVVIDDAHIVEWLNGRRLLVPCLSWRKRNQFSVSFASN